ncbi:helix-turn-helix transcriptional regulator [Aestuariimicrobium sp. p3-SID1156]|uniref:heat shock protein transcriptional repressor HspR n=1 Tax=Aestuariimicrobium sp. p3-SID1156 TaxID=2916038 RepID=UPI00223B305A|nr:helix-turn-helix transcriptional regulator [Aestuariimicrobium sp. p3-SID1156]MCT1458371.1 helix-turn-helix transcriptional regulator [Aestuariimicrobium sp. p3-SID1156]
MSSNAVQKMDPRAAVFTISVAAHLSGMHPQTLRTYDRLGLVQPQRTRGRGRRYSVHDINKLRLIQQLSQGEGINLNGIQRILQMDAEIEALRESLAQVARERDEALARRDEERIFTAGPTGAVNLGRQRVRQVLALPPASAR